jgi:hypothetical protein
MEVVWSGFEIWKWRADEDERWLLRSQKLFRPAVGIDFKNIGAQANTKPREVFFDIGDKSRIFFNKEAPRCAPAECFHANHACAREDIHEAETVEVTTQNAEEGLTCSLRGWP